MRHARPAPQDPGSGGPAVDVQTKLAEIRDLVASARAMPLSASCLVNRSDLLERLADLEAALPQRLGEADRVLADADAVVAAARDEAATVLAEAAVERERRLELTGVGSEAVLWATQIRAEAEQAAADRTAEVDHYVDGKLANFEVVLEKTLELARREPDAPDSGPDAPDPAAQLGQLGDMLERTLVAIRRGRDRLAGRHDMEDLGEHVRALETPADDGPTPS